MRLAKKWVVLFPTIVLATTAFVAWPYLPKRYQSGTTIQVVPQRVPKSYVSATVTERVEDRLRAIAQQVVSRTQLEKLILEFNLFPDERRKLPMEDVVEVMTDRITIEPLVAGATARRDTQSEAFRVSFDYQDPSVTQKVVQKLADFFVDTNARQRAAQAEQTSAFLASQLDEIRRRLVEHATTLERARTERNANEVRLLTLEQDVLDAAYKSLLVKAEDSRLAASLEQRQIGEQFRILDPPGVPRTPLGLTRSRLTFFCAVAGLCLGLTLVVASALRRARSA